MRPRPLVLVLMAPPEFASHSAGPSTSARHPCRVSRSGSSAREDGGAGRAVHHGLMTTTAVARGQRRTAAAMLAALAAVTLSACSQSAQARTCDRMDGVSSAIENLRNVTISENGMAALKQGLV